MFIWNDISSDDMNIKVVSLPPPNIATKKATYSEVEGRDGYLTQLGAYQSDLKQIEADYFGTDFDGILNWLTGSGKIIFGNMPDRYYKAMIDNKIPLSEYIKNQIYNFPISFKCQPFGYLLEGEEIITFTAPTTIYNQGTHESKPYLKIYGSGDITLYINNSTCVFKGVVDYIEIDSEIMNAYKNVGGSLVNCNNLMYSPFPILETNENNISWTGEVTEIQIIPRWRCKV